MKKVKNLLLIAVLTIATSTGLWAKGVEIDDNYVPDPKITEQITQNPQIIDAKLKAAMLKEIENPESIQIDIQHISPEDTALGRFKQINVIANRSTVSDIVVDKARLQFVDVALNTKKLLEEEKIRPVNKCTINMDVTVKEDDLNKLLELKAKKNRVDHPKVKLGDGNIELSGSTKYGFVKVEFWAKGSFSVKDDSEIWFHASKMKVNRVSMPRNFIGSIIKKINPLLNFSKFSFNVNVESIRITNGQIRITSFPD